MKAWLAIVLGCLTGCATPSKDSYTFQRSLHEDGSYVIFTSPADQKIPTWRKDAEDRARLVFASFFEKRPEPHEFTSVLAVDFSNGWAAVVAVVGTKPFIDRWKAEKPYDVWIALRKEPDITIKGRLSKTPNPMP